MDPTKNFAYSHVATAPSPAGSGTSLVVTAGEGARFPDPATYGAYNVTVWPAGEAPTPDNAEICRVTGLSTDTLTITREQESSSARTILVGDQIAMTITAKVITDLQNMAIQSQVRNETPGGTINGTTVEFTTAGVFSSGSLQVYQNGQRLVGGGTDYTEDADLQGFTMVTAPETGETLRVDYNTNAQLAVYGSSSFVYNETVNETPNGSTTAFTVDNAYQAGTTMVFRDGQLMNPGASNDYTESDPATGQVTFATAPETGSVITVSYQMTLSVAGNADAVDGVHASAYSESGKLQPDYDGWRKISETLTYASASTITIPGDWTGKYQVGDKLKITQTTAKYFYITAVSYSSPNTTITVNGGSDYTVANAAITLPYYSKAENPQGFPSSFAYTATHVGFSSNPSFLSRFSLRGNVVTLFYSTSANGTSNATTYTITLPITAKTITNKVWKNLAQVVDNGTIALGVVYVASAGTTAILRKDIAETNFTNSGDKRANFTVLYEI